ncbi:MAG: hypothetical protein GX122_01270 [Candidatus Cloacimonetes bacterium]|nr:hypothetical protein [Candidatus Cloacimonadota bacterium]NLO11038.1 hypothetical protein [Candidatus Cloacimonadota bacterium]
MKQIGFILLIILATSWLGAATFEEVLESYIDDGYAFEYDGNQGWMLDELYFDRSVACEALASMAVVFLYQRLEWGETSNPAHKKVVDDTYYLTTHWFDVTDSGTYVVGVVMSDLIWYYEEDIYDMSPSELEEDIFEQMYYYSLAFEWEEE